MGEPNYWLEKKIPGYKVPKPRDEPPKLDPATAKQTTLFGGEVSVADADPEFKKIFERRARREKHDQD